MKNWSQLWMEGTLWLEAQMAQARIARYRERISMAPTASLGPEAIIDNLQGDKECIVIGEHSYVRGRLLTYGHGGQITIGEWCYIGARSEVPNRPPVWFR